MRRVAVDRLDLGAARVVVVDNPRRVQSAALNRALDLAKLEGQIGPEGGVGEMTVAVEEGRHTVAGWGRFFLSEPVFPVPHRHWI